MNKNIAERGATNPPKISRTEKSAMVKSQMGIPPAMKMIFSFADSLRKGCF